MNTTVTGKVYTLTGPAKGEVAVALKGGSQTVERLYVISSESFRILADGSCPAELWCNGEGDAPTFYEARLPGGDRFTFSIPAGTTEVTWSQLRALTQLPAERDETLKAYIDQRLASGGTFPTDPAGRVIIDCGSLF